MPVKPFEPSRISSAQAAQARASARRRQPWTLPVGDSSVKVFARALGPSAADITRWIEVQGRTGDATFKAFVAERALEALIQQFHPFFLWQELISSEQIATLSWILSVLSAETPALRLAQPVIDSVAPFAASEGQEMLFKDVMAFVVESGGLVAPVLLAPDAVLGNLLRVAIAAQPLATEFAAEVATKLRFILLGPDLPAEDVRRLRIGDVVIGEAHQTTFDGYAVVPGLCAQHCAMQGRNAIFAGPLLSPLLKSLETYRMADTKTQGAELPITIVFELGQCDLPIAQIASIDKGYVFDLGRAPAGLVDIVAGSRLIGTGEIVDIDGRTGVCVVSLVV